MDPTPHPSVRLTYLRALQDSAAALVRERVALTAIAALAQHPSDQARLSQAARHVASANDELLLLLAAVAVEGTEASIQPRPSAPHRRKESRR